MLDKTQLDPLTYRDAMSRLAGHVHIVTAAHEGERRGVTITAACSVSDSPATLLVCLNSANPRNDIFARSGSFALNLLGADQMDLAQMFSGRNSIDPAARFEHGTWDELKTGAPILARGRRGLRLPVNRYQDGGDAHRAVRRGRGRHARRTKAGTRLPRPRLSHAVVSSKTSRGNQAKG